MTANGTKVMANASNRVPQPSGGQKRNRMRKSALKPVLYTFFSILAVA